MPRRITGGLVAVVLASAGCGGEDRATETPISGDQLTVYSSGPLHGPLAGVARDVIRGQKLALAEAGGRAGPFQVTFVALDSADPRTGRWSPRRVADNAREAVRDRQAIAYLGELESGASTVSAPVLNEGGLLQVSPRDTFGGLTQPGGPGEPERFYPSGRRTFTRLVPPDGEQAALLVRAMRAAGVDRLALADDDRPAGFGVGDRVARLATAAGITVVGRRQLDPRRPVPPGLASGLRDTRPDAFLYAGANVPYGARLLRAVHRALPRARLFAADELALEPGLAARLGPAPQRLVVSALRVGTAGGDAAFARRFTAAYAAPPGPQAVLGYDSMRLVLRAVTRIGPRAASRRALVREALRAPVERRSRFRANRARGTRLVPAPPRM